MAEFRVSGLDSLMLSLSEIETIPEDVKDEILNEQADALVDHLKLRGEGYGVDDTGKLLKSIKKGKPKRGKDGARKIVVSPRGSRTRGVDKKQTIKNTEIGFLVNYGVPKKKIPAKPFWTDTEALSAMTMERIAAEVYDKWLKSLNL